MPDLPMQELLTWAAITAETRSILLIGMQRNDFPDSGNTQRKYGSAQASAFH